MGQASLLRVPHDIQWVGLHSYSPATITSGNSATPGTLIVFLDINHGVYIEVAGPDTIRVHSIYADKVESGTVTLMW